MICYICGKENWHKVMSQVGGKLVPVHRQMTTQICKECGSACHDVDTSKEEEIKQFYRKDYRPKPTVTNLITTTHKQNYIQVFLKDLLQKATAEKRQLMVGDVGAATGYLCNFFRQLGHKVTGCELTINYRRMSEHYYGIPLTEELETKHKYDLITVYHVLEHMMKPDEKLAHYASLLAPGGHILIATPEWFDIIEEAAGVAISDHPDMSGFEHLFHRNHINLFSKTSLQNLFRKCGLQIVKEDFLQYGQTYLLKKREQGQQENWLTKEDWHEVERIMLLQKHAIGLYCQGNYREAYEAYPNFPDAWLSQIFGKSAKDQAKQVDLFEEAEKHVGTNLKFVLSKAQWLDQHGEIAKAISLYSRFLATKPNEDAFVLMGKCLAMVGRNQEAIRAMQIAYAMCPIKWQECSQWILETVSRMPTWDERLLMEAQNAVQLKPAEANG